MKRREFLGAVAAVTLAPLAVNAAVPEARAYTPGMAQKDLAAGKVVFLDFSATWCSTCKAQERVMLGLREENPAYDANISFIKVDWDDYGDGELSNSLRIPRRSTLVVLQGDKELGRVVAGTSRKQIKKLMDIALKAATA
jgi:thiol-disulfide isomerase/thioredoxin